MRYFGGNEDKQMNDIKTSEIIKGLEACLGNDNGCVDCPNRYRRDCTRELLRDSLEFINGQKAEIVRLKKINNDLTADNKQRYNAGAKDFVNALVERSASINSEGNRGYYVTSHRTVSTILKQLTEENEVGDDNG